jgi:hypothetical protein
MADRTVTVKVDDLDILLDCYESCVQPNRIEAWCEEVGNDMDAVGQAEDRLREAVGKMPNN